MNWFWKKLESKVTELSEIMKIVVDAFLSRKKICLMLRYAPYVHAEGGLDKVVAEAGTETPLLSLSFPCKLWDELAVMTNADSLRIRSSIFICSLKKKN